MRPFLKSFLVVSALFSAMNFSFVGAKAQETKSAEAPIEGGTLIYLDKQVHTNLYPPLAGTYTNGGILNQIIDRLTYQNPKTLEIEPWLATSWEVNDDASEYTFHLRPNVTFSDQTPLDAQIVANNFDVYGLGNTQLRQPISEVVNNYERSEVVDPLTVRFYFKAPSPGFLQATSTINSGIIAQKTLDLPFDQMGDATKIIGSGPFVIESETLGKQILLSVRKDYDWAPQKSPHQGRAYLDEMKFLTVPEDSVRIGALIAGQAHFIRQLQAYDEKRVEDAGNIVYSVSTRGVNNSVIFRPDNPLVRDVKVRQALLHATDRPEILKTLYSDHYPLATSIMAHNAFGYSDQSEKLKFDEDLSNRLLDEAGWIMAHDGKREKNGKKLILTAYEAAQQPQSKAMLQLIAQQWKRVGVVLNVKNYDGTNSVIDNLDPEKTPVATSMVGRADPDVLKSLYYPKNRDSLLQKGGISDKVQNFVDEKLNKELEDIAKESDPQKRNELLIEATNHMLQKAYVIPIFEEPQVYGGAAFVKGVGFEAVGRPSFYNSWIAQ
ncbi:TIGR04028 family ABC transporter substrate-binding protein [Bartonella tamiae]|uniref:ABC transporter substrate binding protein n=1 Tax=Bartonella tamiae Th239 TaxID=1094558 RepID=J1JVX6_9HYPH|nr:TIGR04028 family ABC transporter substrate-binding protein [Bartonella tamiae]EJF89137.1 ABC transporter substrate binding protein [Bartonella tamiae Th239]EJF95460.1 ABC transporter substrate binding protein [Bartonella tamiae Th307]